MIHDRPSARWHLRTGGEADGGSLKDHEPKQKTTRMKQTARTLLTAVCLLWTLGMGAQVKEVTWDARSLSVNGRRVLPVMGEVHFSRLPETEWAKAVEQMKTGGVTMIATYVFWNHIEEVEGQFDWSGQRNLRRFLEICRAAEMPVILRLGPFCHGEVRNGGIPDWVYLQAKRSDSDPKSKPLKVRSTDPQFLRMVAALYRQIFTQVQGLQWKDGGPVIACQFDNEYRGSGDYLVALKKIAREVGFDLPFYTRTGWPELTKPVPFGEMLPLYGDYADGFWERSIAETAGDYWKAFFFKPFRSSTAIASEQFKDQQERISKGDEAYPYFTCELGGGMATAYHRRPYLYADDALAMAVVKLGSGSNLLGYYMYHGGTNPDGKLTDLNEKQQTPATNYNDMPVKTYDFQAPLGEFGQRNASFYRLRPLHLFINDFQESLAAMDATFPNAGKPVRKGDDSYLRWSCRAAGDSGFVFFSNYERLQKLSAKRGIRFGLGSVTFPRKPMEIPAGAIGIFPVNMAGIRYATAQLVARRDGRIYLMQLNGVPVEIALQNGKTIRPTKAPGTRKPVWRNIYLLTEEEAERLFLEPEKPTTDIAVSYRKVQEAGPLRTIPIGVNRVAEEPTDADFDRAAIYTLDLPADAKGLMEIDYHGDCARLYADGKLIADNFYYGRPFLYGLWRLPSGVSRLELRILPLQENAPVYLPREADRSPGEQVRRIWIKCEAGTKK